MPSLTIRDVRVQCWPHVSVVCWWCCVCVWFQAFEVLLFQPALLNNYNAKEMFLRNVRKGGMQVELGPVLGRGYSLADHSLISRLCIMKSIFKYMPWHMTQTRKLI